MNKYRDFDNYLKEYPTEDGYFGKYGGNYLDDPELVKAFKEYAEGYLTIAQSAQFINELRRIRKDFQGRPTPVYHCERLSRYLGLMQIYLKREDLNHSGAHKLNHCMGEGLLAKYMGKKKLIAETGAGVDRLAFSPLAEVGESTVAAAVERGADVGTDLALRPTRIVSVGDATFAMNGPLASRANANRDFFLNCVAYLSGMDASGGDGTESGLLQSGLDRDRQLALVLVLVGILPASVWILLTAVIFIRRRRA